MSVNGRLVAAHRMSWALTRGPIPAGAQIRHLCPNRLCVNPAHNCLLVKHPAPGSKEPLPAAR